MNKDTQQHRLKKAAPLLNSIISVTASAAAAAICLAAQSEEPLETLIAFFISPFTNTFYFGNMLDQASLILLCAMGFRFYFRFFETISRHYRTDQHLFIIMRTAPAHRLRRE